LVVTVSTRVYKLRSRRDRQDLFGNAHSAEIGVGANDDARHLRGQLLERGETLGPPITP
jgi:hypothetical protein